MSYNPQLNPTVGANFFRGIDPTGAADSSAGIVAAMTTLKGSGIGLFFDGTYKVANPSAVPNGMYLKFSSSSKLVSTIAPLPDPATAPFFAVAVYGGSTTLAADTRRGANSISVNGTVGGTIVAGATIVIGSATVLFHTCTRKVTAVVGGGPFTVFLDEPLLDVYLATDPVSVVISQPSNIRIEGDSGAIITGTGTRYIEIENGFQCSIAGFTVNNSAGMVTDLLFSFDVASRWCGYENMFIDAGGAAGTVGLGLESAENSSMKNCATFNCAVAGVGLYDCFSCVVENTSAGGCGAGAVFTADGNTVGGRDNVLRGGDYNANTIGISVAFGTDQTVAPASCADNTASGIKLEATSSQTTVRDCTCGDSTASAITNGGARNRYRNVTIQNCALGLDATTGDEIDIDGLNLFGTFTGNAVQSNIDIRARGVTGLSVGAINFWLINTGRVDIEQCRITAGNGSNVFNNAGVLSLSQTVAIAVGGGIGVVATAGTIRINDSVNLDGCTTPILPGPGVLNRLQVVANGTTPVVVPWPDLKSTDRVVLTLFAASPAPPVLLGTPQVTYNPGVGFSVTGMQTLDASTYDAVVG